MGNSATKFRRAIQQGNEVAACQLYVQNPDIRDKLDPCTSYGDNQDHNTPLHFAAKYGMKSLLRDFMIRGGNPNKVNNSGQTALHMLMMAPTNIIPAADQRRLDCLFLLLKWKGRRGSDGEEQRLNLNAVDKKKRTPLHLAASFGLFLCLQCLVAKDASLFLEDSDNLTACDLAERSHHMPIAAFLEAKMVFHSETQICDTGVDPGPSILNYVDEEFSGLCNQDLQDAKDQLIVETSDMLQVPLFTAEALLCFHNWCREDLLESWMQDSFAVCEKAGVPLSQEHRGAGLVKSRKEDSHYFAPSIFTGIFQSGKHCDICDELLYLDKEIPEIPCGHTFCEHCWERYLSTKISDGETQKILCPGHNCNLLVPVETTEKLVSRDMAKRYLQFDLKAFVDTNPNLRWCPHPNCGRAIRISTRSSLGSSEHAKSVDCGMGHFFCWQCLDEAHEPCSCSTWQNWTMTVKEMNPQNVDHQLEERQSVATSYWLISNSKQCPSCRNHIQKNEGCNHMTCAKCKHDFCWVCLEPWKLHSAETGGYFRCERFDIVKKVEEDHEREQQEIEKEHDQVEKTNRFLQYYTKFKNHESKFELEARLLRVVHEKIRCLQNTARELGADNADAQFIDDAMRELLKSRQILKGSYPYAYFMGNLKGERNVFEFMQDEVEVATQELSHMIARPFLKTQHYIIMNATSKLTRKRKEFLTAIGRGLIPDDELDPLPLRNQRPTIRIRHEGQQKLDCSNGTQPLATSRQQGRHRGNVVHLSDSDSDSDYTAVIRDTNFHRHTSAEQSDGSLTDDEFEHTNMISAGRSPHLSEASDDYSAGTRIPSSMLEHPCGTVVAQFDYAAYSNSELAIEAGDVIEVVQKRTDGWWRGKCNGRQGLFPSTFVVELESIENAAPLTAENPVNISKEGREDELLCHALAMSAATEAVQEDEQQK